MWLDNVIKQFLSNWTIICLLFSGTIVLIMSIIVNFIPAISMDKHFYFTFIYIACSSLVLTLLEIRSLLKPKIKSFSEYYDTMRAAQDDIFMKLTTHLAIKKKEPVILRIQGIRLNKISVVLLSFAARLRNQNYNRKLIIKLYCSAPEYFEYLSSIKLENKPLHTRTSDIFKEQIKKMEMNFLELERICENHSVINSIDFKKYSSIPSFWAYEIDKEDIFWGYFLWDDDYGDWIGSESQCYYFNRYNQPINGLTDWIHNQLDSLDIWALPFFSSENKP